MPLSFRDVLKTKDAQGHGSNARGSSPLSEFNVRTRAEHAKHGARIAELRAEGERQNSFEGLKHVDRAERAHAAGRPVSHHVYRAERALKVPHQDLHKAATDPAKLGAAAAKASTAAFTENTPQSHMAAHQAHMDACAAYEAVPQTQSTQRAIQHHTSRADDHFESAKGAANQASEDARASSGAIGKADEFAAALLKRVATSLESEETPEAFRADIQTLIAKFKESEAGDPDTVTIVKLGGDEQQIVWGWGLVSTERNQPLTDLQGDIVDTGDLQKAVHETFMDNGRVGKMMHAGRQVGEIVDSIVFTKDLQRALGIDLGKEGWFVGYKVTDPKVWSLVKRGVLKAFSIGGTGERHPVLEKAKDAAGHGSNPRTTAAAHFQSRASSMDREDGARHAVGELDYRLSNHPGNTAQHQLARRQLTHADAHLAAGRTRDAHMAAATGHHALDQVHAGTFQEFGHTQKRHLHTSFSKTAPVLFSDLLARA